MPSPSSVFALLDDYQAQATTLSSRLYSDYVHQHLCVESAQWEAVCEAVNQDLQAGLHAVVLADYEWGVQLHLHKDKTPFTTPPPINSIATPPTCRFLIFRQCERLSHHAVQAWLADADYQQDPQHTLSSVTRHTSVAGIANIQPSCSKADFTQTFHTILQALQAGEMYQMNFTYSLAFDAFGSPLTLYRHLSERQPTAYGALIALPNGEWILSFSPELFLRHQGGKLVARPMKGTAARSLRACDHHDRAAELASSPKNRAENVMIVDLLRNDLSQVAQLGSVRVPELFNVEPYGSVWQMSSTVEARLKQGITFAQIMLALFPCGSITGAPKHRSMQWINQLENRPRGLYTGAIGWLEAASQTTDTSVSKNQTLCGDFCLSVAIRTLILTPTDRPLHWSGTLGIGAGIVLESTAEEEWEECRLKARFLTGLETGFTILETLYATRENGIRHARQHARRLRRAAKRFGFVWEPRQIYQQLHAALTALPACTSNEPQAFKIRLSLEASGTCTLSTEPLPMRPTEPVPIALASELGLGSAFECIVDEDNAPSTVPPLLRSVPPADRSSSLEHRDIPLWLQYKTSFRPHYHPALQLAKAYEVFDLLFVNPNGELTEGVRTNVFLKLNGHWYSPPTSSGLLPGTLRATLLQDPHFQASERVLTLKDVYAAEEIIVCNALWGPLRAYLKNLRTNA